MNLCSKSQRTLACVMAVRGLEIEVRREFWNEPGAGAR
jgi:hypothetical protein